MSPELATLHIADEPSAWKSLGFTVDDGVCEIGGIRVTLGAEGTGITAWSITNLDPATTDIDGLPTTTTGAEPTPLHQQTSHPHPNGATGIDHVVVVTPHFDKSAEKMEAAGIPLRRIRHVPAEPPFRQGFRRLGPAILELVEVPQAPRTAFWGLVIIVADLEALANRLGEHLQPIKPAVQPGRQIATLNRTAGLTPAIAFMDPERST
jgi:hypothetical protein